MRFRKECQTGFFWNGTTCIEFDKDGYYYPKPEEVEFLLRCKGIVLEGEPETAPSSSEKVTSIKKPRGNKKA